MISTVRQYRNFSWIHIIYYILYIYNLTIIKVKHAKNIDGTSLISIYIYIHIYPWLNGKVWRSLGYSTLSMFWVGPRPAQALSFSSSSDPRDVNGSCCSRCAGSWVNRILAVGSFRYVRAKWLPSGNLLHSYWKWPFIMDLPIKHGDFP